MRFLIVLITLLITGCSSTPMKNYDRENFPIINTGNLKFSTELKIGDIKSGHSSWISSKDFNEGKNPTYYCHDQQRHSWFDHTWMFGLVDQNNIQKNINDILISNSSYDVNSTQKILIYLKSIEQGPGDSPVYTFDVDITIFKEGSEVFHKNHHLKGNEMSEEFFASGSWTGAKKRATSRLVTLIINDINTYLTKSNKSLNLTHKSAVSFHCTLLSRSEDVPL